MSKKYSAAPLPRAPSALGFEAACAPVQLIRKRVRVFDHARVAGACLALLTCACAGTPRPTSTAAPAPSPTAVSSSKGDGSAQSVAQQEDVEAAKAVADALARVSKLRELPAKGAVRSEVLSRAAMAQRVQDHIKTEVPAEAVVGQAEILVALGLTPPDFDLVRSLTDLMGAELAGFYEPSDKTMYLAADLRGQEQYATLSHELVHALQDQYYDLAARVAYHPDEGDIESAIHALAEGDATSAMLDDMLQARGATALDLSEDVISVQVRSAMELSPASANIPAILKHSVIVPYIDGVKLVHYLRRRGGWKAVDEVWRNPPQSTEQVLHPEKLFPREMPEPIAVPSAPPEGPRTLLYSDVLGEQGLRLVLEEWMPRAVADAGASDWSGDRIAVFREGTRLAVAWLARWDSAAATARGFEALARGGLAFDKSRKTSSDPKAAAAAAAARGRFCVERSDNGPFALALRGRNLAAVFGWYERAAPMRSAGTCDAALKWLDALLAAKP